MSFEELRRWSKWIGTVENTIEKSLLIIVSGRRLLSEENLKPFIEIIEDQDEIKMLRKFTLPNVVSLNSRPLSFRTKLIMSVSAGVLKLI